MTATTSVQTVLDLARMSRRHRLVVGLLMITMISPPAWASAASYWG